MALHEAEAQFQNAFTLADEARERRNDLVRLALSEGWTHAQIAEATGMTRGRVGQLAQISRQNA